MNTEEAKKKLESQGHIVQKLGGGMFRVGWYGEISNDKESYMYDEPITGRQLCKHARHLGGRGRWKKLCKFYSDKKNRSANRDKLNQGKYDEIPLNKPTKPEDPWAWD